MCVCIESGPAAVYMRIGLHELSVSTDEMSPLGTEETQCCSHQIDVKYYSELVLHICFGAVRLLNGWRKTPDTFPNHRNVLWS